MRCALGLSLHTGWAAAVVAAGTVESPRVLLREELELLPDPERFVFHRAAELDRSKVDAWLADAHARLSLRAREVLSSLRARVADVDRVALVAKSTPMPGPLNAVLAAHPKLHTAEACFYRDTLKEVATELGLKVSVFPPTTALTVTAAHVGRPWARDQRLAAHAAWLALTRALDRGDASTR